MPEPNTATASLRLTTTQGVEEHSNLDSRNFIRAFDMEITSKGETPSVTGTL